jgi:ATP phosphoribosyltransferase
MQMGTADAILDLVSSGTTLRENNLKEISGGSVLSSQVYIYRPVSLKACFMYLVAFFSSQF